MSNVIKAVPQIGGSQREEEQVTGTECEEDGITKYALDVNIVKGGGDAGGVNMTCESGVIDLVKNIELTIDLTTILVSVCDVTFFDDRMNRILIGYKIVGPNRIIICSNRDKSAVTFKAQGV